MKSRKERIRSRFCLESLEGRIAPSSIGGLTDDRGSRAAEVGIHAAAAARTTRPATTPTTTAGDCGDAAAAARTTRPATTPTMTAADCGDAASAVEMVLRSATLMTTAGG